MQNRNLLVNTILGINMAGGIAMSNDTIFQPTDLVQRRTEFLEAARKGGARLRDKDGTSLVMLPESHVLLLEELGRWTNSYMRLETLLRRDARPSVSELGDLAWLRVFDQEDLRDFVTELHDALVAARADDNVRAVTEVIDAWRITAAQLDDPLRRSVLLGSSGADDFVEAAPPHEH